MCCPETSITTDLRYITSQKNEYLIYTAVETWSLAQLLCDPHFIWLTNSTSFRLEKLMVSQLVKDSPAFNSTRRFITAFTRARQLSVFRARSIQRTSLCHSSWRPNLILSFHLRLGLSSALFFSGFPYENCVFIYNMVSIWITFKEKCITVQCLLQYSAVGLSDADCNKRRPR